MNDTSERLRGEDRIARYIALLHRYRTTLNLVSNSESDTIERLVERSRDYGESVRRCTEEGDTILDVGSGAGIPGLVIACLLPDRDVILVERRRRRAHFLDLASAHAGLTNTTVHRADVRDVAGYRASAVTAQSVMLFDALYCATRHLHAAEVTLLSGKGGGWDVERDSLAARAAPTDAEAVEIAVETRGTIVALRLEGGRTCRSLGSSTKKGA